jgi:outer membrane protein
MQGPPTPLFRPGSGRVFLAAAAAIALVAGGCSSSPLAEESDRDLRRSVIETIRRESADAKSNPNPRQVERETGVERLGISPKILDELNTMGGPTSYQSVSLPLNEDLLGRPQKVVAITLQHAVKTAVENNLQVQFARLAPALSEAQVVQAEAAFDWTFFQNLNYTNQDAPRARNSLAPSTTGLTSDVQQNVVSTTGLRQRLTSGGQLTVQQDLTYSDPDTPGQLVSPDPNTQLGVLLQFDQPLLRNFGSDVALAEVQLNRNAERNAISQLKRDLIRTVTDTEKTYWTLVRSHRDLLILQRLLTRGVEVRDQLEIRSKLDAIPAQIADAKARIERRKADLLRGQNALRQTSDRLKALMNDPDLPVGSDILVVPIDDVVDAPISFSLLDSIETAISQRPEIQQSVLSIDDTSIRQNLAESGRLPQLDLRLQTRWWALEEDAADAYAEVFDGNFIDYLVGMQFEQPIGNRRAEAEFRRRRIERSQAVISYRNTVQQVMLEVKGTLDNVATNFRLIEQTRVGRVAASEVLRALLVEKETIAGKTVERLDLELNRQEQLAQAERDEIGALVDYNSSIADLYAAMGTALERNRIEFVVPKAEEILMARPVRRSSNTGDSPPTDAPTPQAEPSDVPPTDAAPPGSDGSATPTEDPAAPPADADPDPTPAPVPDEEPKEPGTR